MLCAVSDWNRFLECVPWFVEPGQAVVVGDTELWTRGPVPGLPSLSGLLGGLGRYSGDRGGPFLRVAGVGSCR